MNASLQTIRHGPMTNFDRSFHDVGPDHFERVEKRLWELGLSNFAVYSEEGRYLPRVIHENEAVEGAVYGRAKNGFALLVATDRRVIFLDIKPLFSNEEEVTYDIVGGVSHSRAGLTSIVTLSTSIKTYRIKTFNKRAATGFMEAIERQRVEHLERRSGHDNDAKKRGI